MLGQRQRSWFSAPFSRRHGPDESLDRTIQFERLRWQSGSKGGRPVCPVCCRLKIRHAKGPGRWDELRHAAGWLPPRSNRNCNPGQFGLDRLRTLPGITRAARRAAGKAGRSYQANESSSREPDPRGETWHERPPCFCASPVQMLMGAGDKPQAYWAHPPSANRSQRSPERTLLWSLARTAKRPQSHLW